MCLGRALANCTHTLLRLSRDSATQLAFAGRTQTTEGKEGGLSLLSPVAVPRTMPSTMSIADRWEVRTGKEVGEGGFGKVYMAFDGSEDPPLEVAAKKVPLKNDADHKGFREELSVLKTVHDHGSIITLMGDAEETGVGWMFMEMASGGELFDRLIESGSLSEKAAWPYVRGLVEALAHCHSKGVVHRDVKLENVMLCAEDPRAVRLIDFGLALQLDIAEGEPGGIAPNQTIKDPAGTQAYRAPEVSRAGYEPSKVDVWSTAIVLFSLASGFFPLQEAHPSDWRFKKLAAQQADGLGACEALYKMYKRNCPFSPALRELLNGMLEIDPAKRLSLSAVLSSEWLSTDPCGAADADDDDDKPVYRSASGDGDFGDAGAPVELTEDMIPICRQRAKRVVDADADAFA